MRSFKQIQDEACESNRERRDTSVACIHRADEPIHHLSETATTFFRICLMDRDLDGGWQPRNRDFSSTRASTRPESPFNPSHSSRSKGRFSLPATFPDLSLGEQRNLVPLSRRGRSIISRRLSKKISNSSQMIKSMIDAQVPRDDIKTDERTIVRRRSPPPFLLPAGGQCRSSSTIIDADRQHPAKRAWNSVSVRVNGVRIYRDRNRQSVEG